MGSLHDTPNTKNMPIHKGCAQKDVGILQAMIAQQKVKWQQGKTIRRMAARPALACFHALNNRHFKRPLKRILTAKHLHIPRTKHITRMLEPTDDTGAGRHRYDGVHN